MEFNNFGMLENNFGKLENNFGKPENNFGKPENNFGKPENNFDKKVERIPTRNENLEGKEHPTTGVKYEKVTTTVDGKEVEVVVPKFDSKYDAQIPEDLYEEKDREQFKECNKQLYEKIQNDPDFAKKFTPEQIDQIKDGMRTGTAPDGYVWHHDAKAGRIQLVDSSIHSKTGHTGGRTIWGGGNDNR